MSRPYALPVSPTRRADSRTSIPPPEPRSSTRSPARSSATASGLPQPRLAASASGGSASCSSTLYIPTPNVSSTATDSGAHDPAEQQLPDSDADGPQHPSAATASRFVLPRVTAVAAAAYRSRTCSRRSASVIAHSPIDEVRYIEDHRCIDECQYDVADWTPCLLRCCRCSPAI